MTKTYSGDPGPPPKVYIKSGKGKPKILRAGSPIEWGSPGAPGAAVLALAILIDALDDENRANRLFGRFKHRVIADLKPEQPWTLTLEFVLATVADIENVERQTAMTRRMVAQEPPPVAPGGLGQDMAWSKNPELKPNIPERKS